MEGFTIADFFKRFMQKDESNSYQKPAADDALSLQLSENLLDTIVKIRELSDNTGDLLVREMTVCGVKTAFIMCEGMFNLQTFTEIVIEPITQLAIPDATADSILDWTRNKTILAGDVKEFYTYGELFQFIMSGFIVLLVEGKAVGTAMGLQGFNFRSIAEPTAEMNVRGSREGFVEALRVNMTMIRRRMKTPTLKLEMLNVGVKSKTDICLVYRTDVVSKEMLQDIRNRISKIDMDIVLESGYLQPYFERKPLSFFTGVGVTERPDTMCAKVSEGRVGILFDGTPFALIIPYLFSENFQSFDDYANRAYYATFIRCLKYISFLITIFLPGIYVAMAVFHPELFPNALLFSIVTSEEAIPFPIMIEALFIHFAYEIMHEAGLRLPKAVGHAVSIVGALVIGSAAVTAGLIAAPMVMVVALTAISSFVVASLYEPVTILRFGFILLGGTLGIFGITLGAAVVFVNLCAINTVGVPATSPGAPFNLYAMRDTVVRWSWTGLSKRDLKIQDLPGSEISSDSE